MKTINQKLYTAIAATIKDFNNFPVILNDNIRHISNDICSKHPELIEHVQDFELFTKVCAEYNDNYLNSLNEDKKAKIINKVFWQLKINPDGNYNILDLTEEYLFFKFKKELKLSIPFEPKFLLNFDTFFNKLELITKANQIEVTVINNNGLVINKLDITELTKNDLLKNNFLFQNPTFSFNHNKSFVFDISQLKPMMSISALDFKQYLIDIDAFDMAHLSMKGLNTKIEASLQNDVKCVDIKVADAFKTLAEYDIEINFPEEPIELYQTLYEKYNAKIITNKRTLFDM